jgi:hypothetical protein
MLPPDLEREKEARHLLLEPGMLQVFNGFLMRSLPNKRI